ncbi:hypothetical protein SDC9_84190 [bioreactor metagenome]|uniref:Uncharacterized protein n=1 Tax=bioreactor metagenome TaxID=1076179 RepID=A0A644Z9Q7_9ZZZZ
MEKSHNKKVPKLIIVGLIILSIVNLIRIFYYRDNTGIFGYISYTANVLAIILIVIDWIKIKSNKVNKRSI